MSGGAYLVRLTLSFKATTTLVGSAGSDFTGAFLAISSPRWGSLLESTALKSDNVVTTAERAAVRRMEKGREFTKGSSKVGWCDVDDSTVRRHLQKSP